MMRLVAEHLGFRLRVVGMVIHGSSFASWRWLARPCACDAQHLQLMSIISWQRATEEAIPLITSRPYVISATL